MMWERIAIVTILAAIILAAICYLPVMADDNSSGTTITMNTTSVMAISLDKTEWKVQGEGGVVSSNTTYKTDLPASWCTITNDGNANVTISIKGDDAKWVTHPDDYKWTLSSTGDNGKHMYALWYHIKGDTVDSYTLITKTETSMAWTRDGEPLNLVKHGDTEQFGLKLLTPTYFYAGRTMQTTIIISAVAA
jgi:hypothetical protein